MAIYPRQRLSDLRISGIKPPEEGQDEYPDELRPGLRLRVGSSGKKVWILRTRAGGKPINLKLGDYPALGVAKAREAARQKLEDFAGGALPRTTLTFGEVAADFIERHAKPRNRTWEGQQWQLEKYVLPYWRDRGVTELRKRDVIELLDKITDTGATVTANRVLSLVSKVFRWAEGRDLIDRNPAGGVAKPAQETARDRLLSPDEIRALWQASSSLGYPFGTMARLLLLTGQRRDEVAGMKWADIDMDAKTWTLGRAETKADRRHLVPLSEPVIEILKSLPRLMGKDNAPSPYVLTTTGETPISGFSRAKERLDVFMGAAMKIKPTDLEGWTLHDLRRVAATGMGRAGVQRFIVARVLNHADPSVTGRHYDHAEYTQEKRHALDTWAAEVLRIVGEAPAGNVVPLRGGQ